MSRRWWNRWGRDVCRLNDEVAEGGTKVECLEDGVGITRQECQGDGGGRKAIERTRYFQTLGHQRRSEQSGERRARRSRTFSKPNCFSSAIANVGSRVVWGEEEDAVCWGVANDIHLAAFPIAMLGGDGELEGTLTTTRTRRTRVSGTSLERSPVSMRGGTVVHEINNPAELSGLAIIQLGILKSYLQSFLYRIYYSLVGALSIRPVASFPFIIHEHLRRDSFVPCAFSFPHPVPRSHGQFHGSSEALTRIKSSVSFH